MNSETPDPLPPAPDAVRAAVHSSSAARARRRAAGLAAGLAALAWLAGCDDPPSNEHELAPSRSFEHVGRPIRWNATPAERHGLVARDAAGAGDDAAGARAREASDEASADEHPEGTHLHWSVPPGWSERPPAPFREANFAVAGDERAECYLTALVGEAGGLEANINRWRSQMSLPPLSTAEIAALPRRAWLGAPAVAVDFSGQWSGMSGEETEQDWRLVGLLQVQPEQSLFFKLVGPAPVIAEQLSAFFALADSFRVDAGAAHDAHAAHDHEAEPGSADVADDSQRTASLAWRAPAGWTRGPEKPMRELTYFAGEARAVECSVTLLDGDGGGALANINRWCGQLGAPTLTEADLARLARLPMAGAQGLLVELARGSGATAPEGQELLLGAVCQLPGRALFVKLTGPRAAVEAQREALLAFCGSLEVLP